MASLGRLAALCLLLVAAASAADDVLVVSGPESLDKIVKENDFVVLELYAPCEYFTHSSIEAPMWDRAARIRGPACLACRKPPWLPGIPLAAGRGLDQLLSPGWCFLVQGAATARWVTAVEAGPSTATLLWLCGRRAHPAWTSVYGKLQGTAHAKVARVALCIWPAPAQDRRC
jgi:hypothetical protein